jgi:hypothetical protein
MDILEKSSLFFMSFYRAIKVEFFLDLMSSKLLNFGKWVGSFQVVKMTKHIYSSHDRGYKVGV